MLGTSKTKLYISNNNAKDTLNGYIFMTPTIIILGVFLLLPILLAIVLAFIKFSH
jgi:multiple sugar transport system permease protein